MKRIQGFCCAVFFLFISSFVNAQDVTVLSAQALGWNALASDPEGDFDTLNIPILRIENLILIEAVVDSQRGNFVFDSGAPGLVLNSSYFRSKTKNNSSTAVGIAGASQRSTARVKSLDIGPLHYSNMIVDLTELGHIESKKNVKILGLLGNALFERLEWSIDLRAGLLQIIRPKPGAANYAVINPPDFSFKIDYINHAIFLQTKAANKKLNMIFDTGAEALVLDNQLPKAVMDQLSINRRINLTGTGGQQVEVFAGELSAISLKTLEWENITVVLTGLASLAEIYAVPLDGIIGYDLLTKGKIYVDLPRRTMVVYLYKNENEK